MDTTFTQTGGARLGMFNATWPFATLSATPDRLCLSCFGRKYDFPKSSIRSLSKYSGIFSTGLRIQHTESSFPEFVVFWVSLFFSSSGFTKFKGQLESLGYEIRDRDT